MNKNEYRFKKNKFSDQNFIYVSQIYFLNLYITVDKVVHGYISNKNSLKARFTLLASCCLRLTKTARSELSLW